MGSLTEHIDVTICDHENLEISYTQKNPKMFTEILSLKGEQYH